MRDGNLRFGTLVIFCLTTMLVVLALCFGVGGVQAPGDVDAGRADLLRIDTLKRFGPLQRPPVIFQHDRHTEALAKQDKQCDACHLSDDKNRSLKFKRIEDTDKDAVMDVYHDACISCHRQTASAGLQSGPVTCGECHLKQVEVTSNRLPMGMDKSLHFRHSKALDKKCATCHHEYNAQTQKLFYAEGREGTCRYCHKQETQENRISMRQASHLDCIACHQKTAAAKKEAGPVECKGCHDPEERLLIAEIEAVPRMKRQQPDVVMVKKAAATEADVAPVAGNARMPGVPFDHKAHEASNSTCRVCHHADLDACARCHSLGGTQEGKQIKLAQAMHQAPAGQSCIGCHAEEQQKPVCAGCHAAIKSNPRTAQSECLTCHMAPPGVDSAHESAHDDRLADGLLAARRMVNATYPQADIPDKVKIGALSDQYHQAVFPHGKIVDTLMKNIEESRLAGYFHREPGTICQGCHHNSPAAKKPPACGSCHGQPFDSKDLSRPGLMAAYHQQCMDCHREMGIPRPVATDCTACHKKK